MAEKYGTVPPRFTKKWWEYFWMYYKTYVIVAVFIIITGTVTVHQILSTPKYDITMTYAGTKAFTSEQSALISKKASPLCIDVDENGEKSVDFRQINILESDKEYAATMLQKFTLTLSEEEIYIYICDEPTIEPFIGESPKDSNFIPLEDWCSKKTDIEKTYSRNGVSYGIELTECEFFKKIEKETNGDFSGNYLFVRYYPRKDQLKKQLDGYNAAKKLANKLVTGK